MIIDDKHRGKLLVMWSLVLVFFFAVVYQWLQLKPFAVTASNPDNTWQQINSRLQQSLQSIAANFDLARQQTAALPQELERQGQQRVLLEKAKEYIANYNQASSTEATKE